MRLLLSQRNYLINNLCWICNMMDQRKNTTFIAFYQSKRSSPSYQLQWREEQRRQRQLRPLLQARSQCVTALSLTLNS